MEERDIWREWYTGRFHAEYTFIVFMMTMTLFLFPIFISWATGEWIWGLAIVMLLLSALFMVLVTMVGVRAWDELSSGWGYAFSRYYPYGMSYVETGVVEFLMDNKYYSRKSIERMEDSDEDVHKFSVTVGRRRPFSFTIYLTEDSKARAGTVSTFVVMAYPKKLPMGGMWLRRRLDNSIFMAGRLMARRRIQ